MLEGDELAVEEVISVLNQAELSLYVTECHNTTRYGR